MSTNRESFAASNPSKLAYAFCPRNAEYLTTRYVVAAWAATSGVARCKYVPCLLSAITFTMVQQVMYLYEPGCLCVNEKLLQCCLYVCCSTNNMPLVRKLSGSDGHVTLLNLGDSERAAAFPKWCTETGLFNRRFGVLEQGGTDPRIRN